MKLEGNYLGASRRTQAMPYYFFMSYHSLKNTLWRGELTLLMLLQSNSWTYVASKNWYLISSFSFMPVQYCVLDHIDDSLLMQLFILQVVQEEFFFTPRLSTLILMGWLDHNILVSIKQERLTKLSYKCDLKNCFCWHFWGLLTAWEICIKTTTKNCS